MGVKMTVEQILTILKTREKAAKISGNTTECSFVKELIKDNSKYIEYI